MDNRFFEELASLGNEANVEQDLLIEKVKSAMIKAAKKTYPGCEEIIRVDIDPETQKFEMFLELPIVADEDVMTDSEISLSEAREIEPDAQVGGIIRQKLDIASFGRAAAQSAKQSIRGDLRDIHRERVLAEFEDLEFQCITVKVTQVETGGTVTVMYDNYELYLFHNEQIPNEVLHEGQMIKVYITAIANKQKKPIIKISRTRKELVERLFALEVPEIAEGVVEIKASSREAGSRTKIAVISNDPSVDAIGACIGPDRKRISAVVGEIGGEKIDIIQYSDKIEGFIARALAPAQILDVKVLSEEEHTCTVTVPNNQLSLAIGNRGQNAKLAARLTGYKIDIKPEFEVSHPEWKEKPNASQTGE